MRSTLSTPQRSMGNDPEPNPEQHQPGMEADWPVEALKELAFRAAGGLEVSLVWNAEAGRLAVSVYDARSGDVFDVPAPSDRALDVFYHPYAYAARHGIEYGVPSVGLDDSDG
jgi:hypothetical protein